MHLKYYYFSGVMPKFTQSYLTRLEDIIKELEYKIRYERGNFKSGSCVIEDKKVIVINKFATLEAKIMFLIEALKLIQVDETMLTDKNKTFYQELKQTALSL